MRMNGTVIGSLFGLFAALTPNIGTDGQGGLGPLHFCLLVLWVLVCGYVREGRTPYGGFVAQFTPFIMVEVPDGAYGGPDYEKWALTRITQNMLAVLVFVAVELAFLPAMSSLLIKWRSVKDIKFAAAAVQGCWDAATEDVCEECRSARAEAAGEAIKSLQAGIETQKELLDEARSEPDWYSWSNSHLDHYDALIAVESQHIERLLLLMHTTLTRDLRAEPADATDAIQRLPTSDGMQRLPNSLLSLLRPEARRIKRSLIVWLDSFAGDIEEGVTAGRASVIEEAATQAMMRFEKELFNGVAKVRKNRHSPLCNDLILPLYAFIFCTKELITALQELSRHTRGLCEYSTLHIAMQSTLEWRDEGGGASGSSFNDDSSGHRAANIGRKSLDVVRKSKTQIRDAMSRVRDQMHHIAAHVNSDPKPAHAKGDKKKKGMCEECGTEMATPRPKLLHEDSSAKLPKGIARYSV